MKKPTDHIRESIADLDRAYEATSVEGLRESIRDARGVLELLNLQALKWEQLIASGAVIPSGETVQ